jgi:penicillin V acylase-like amidase (Ntn superfamily)
MLGHRNLRIAAVLLAVGFFSSAGHACSAFVLVTGKRVVVGRTLDVGKAFTGGYLMSNPAGGVRRSVLEESRRPATWTVKHRSVTFNLFGRRFPVGGMNAAGLVVEHLALPATTYPRDEGKPMTLEFEWIQYMLDTCGSVEEFLASARKVAIAPERIKMHFMACDASGDSALLEFIDGKAVVYRGKDLAPAVVTNNTYANSTNYLAGFAGHGGDKPLPRGSRKSLDRFVVATDQVMAFHKDAKDTAAIDTSFEILKSVTNNTLLGVAYDLTNLKVHYRTRRNGTRRTVSLDDVDLFREPQGIMLPMHADPREARPFSVAANNRSIESVVPGHGFLKMDRYVEKMKLGTK